MAEIYEINSFVEVPVFEDGYLGTAVAEMLIETEGEQMYLTATFDGTYLAFGATEQSLMWYYTKLDTTFEDNMEKEAILSAETESYLNDDEDINNSIYAAQYRRLAEMIIEQLRECDIANEGEISELKFWEN